MGRDYEIMKKEIELDWQQFTDITRELQRLNDNLALILAALRDVARSMKRFTEDEAD